MTPSASAARDFAGKIDMRTVVHTFPDTRRIAGRVAQLLGAPCRAIVVHRFPDAESLVRVRAGAGERAILVRSLHDPNAKLLEVLLAADALRRAGVWSLTLVAPYLPYMRQDSVFRPGEPISQRVVGTALARAFDRIVTVQAHLHRVRSLAAVTKRGSSSVSAAPAIAAWVKRHAPGCVVIGPDAESEPMVRAVARASGVAWSVARKERRGDRDVRVHLSDLPPCETAVLVDDIASTGVTLAAVAGALARRGVRCAAALVVHALFAPGALARLRAARVPRIVTTDTIAHPTNALSCAPLLAAALREHR